jgi:hypothetical protein
MRRTHALAALLVTGCALDPAVDPVAPDVERGEPAPSRPVAECTPALAWATPGEGLSYGGQFFDATPDGELVVRASLFAGDAFRASDGALVGAPLDARLAAADAGWRVVAERAEDGVVVRDPVTWAPLFTARPPAPSADGKWLPETVTGIAPRGDALVTATCWSRLGREQPAVLTLSTFSLPDGEPGMTVVVDAPCGPSYAQPGMLLRLTPQGAVVAGLPEGALAFVRLPSGDARTARLALGESLTDAGRVATGVPGGVLAAAVSPDGTRLAVTASDGTLRQIALPDLVELDAPRPVGLVGANQHTYLPSVESPVAFSPDGRVLAHLDAGGDIVLRRLADDAVLHVLEAPWRDAEVDDSDWRTLYGAHPGAVMALRFVGDGLAASLEGGVAMWRCRAPAETVADELAVALDGPEVVNLAEAATFSARIEGAGAPAVRQLLLDGTPVAASLGDTLAFFPYEAGRHVLDLVVEDGTARGAARREIIVRDAQSASP